MTIILRCSTLQMNWMRFFAFLQAVSRLLDENKSTLDSVDVELGTWEFNNSKFQERIQSGRKHLGSLVLQLDSIFCAGAIFLRRNSSARLWSLVYLVCLHFWVLYILFSHSPVSEESRSGAVFSLESINNTGGGWFRHGYYVHCVFCWFYLIFFRRYLLPGGVVYTASPFSEINTLHTWCSERVSTIISWGANLSFSTAHLGKNSKADMSGNKKCCIVRN